jgi:hypothetical protein
MKAEIIKKIEDLLEKGMNPSYNYSQLTIDFCESFSEDFINHERDLSKNPFERDEVLAECYFISTVLDIMDKKKFSKDSILLQSLYNDIYDWAKEIERRNILLGIPKHKG